MTEALPDLHHIPRLPMPDELPEVRALADDRPVFVDEAISLDALKTHLTQAAPDTAEIRITVFEGGVQALEVGTPEGIAVVDPAWSLHVDRAAVDLHTHPNPTDPAHSALPSLPDITNTILGEKPTYIGSHLGISVIPKIATDLWGPEFWGLYAVERGFADQASLKAYGVKDLYRDFVIEAVGMRFIPWRNMRAGLVMADIALL